MASARAVADNAVRMVDEKPPDPVAQAAEDADWAQLKREADAIDPYQYRRRSRIIAAIGFGALGAGIIWAVLGAVDSARNPCARVRDHYCGQSAQSLNCTVYQGIYQESVDDSSRKMRGSIRQQCVTKIQRLKEDDNVEVP
jgi:hypothetical protein